MTKITDRLIRIAEQNRDNLVRLVQELIRIPSVNTPPGGNEKECQEFIACQLETLGMQVEKFRPDDLPGVKESPYFVKGRQYTDRPNVVGKISGAAQGGKSLLLTAHVDVVGPGPLQNWKFDPWGGEISAGRVYGRGSADTKGGLAAQIMAIKCLRESGITLKGNLFFASVVDEEFGGMNGSLGCALNVRPIDGAILAEPTSLAVLPGCAGGQQYEIEVGGKFAFEGQKYLGVNAIEKMYQVINGLASLEKERNGRVSSSPLFATYPIRTPITVISITAGDFHIGGVPTLCNIKVWHGALPGEKKEEVLAELQRSLLQIASVDSWLRENPPRLKLIGDWLDPTEIPVGHPLVVSMVSGCQKVTGKRPSVQGMEGSCDMSRFTLTGIPAVVFGPGDINDSHSANESVDIEQLVAACKVYAVTAIEWCGIG